MSNKKNLFIFLLIVTVIVPFTNVWGETWEEFLDLEREAADERNKTPAGSTAVLVYSNTNWSGSVAHGDGSSSTKDGHGNARFVANCGNLNFVQGLFQKQGEGGYVAVAIIQNGKIIGFEATEAAYGIAHATAECASLGGCLIATATYGTELAPQVQQLRELRENYLMKTKSGSAFMTGFNQFYYTFSPTIADWERQNPVFKEAVKIGITPLLTSLSILNYVDMDSEEEVLGYGISLILLNIGMYIVAPVGIGLFVVSRKSKNS